VSTSTDHHLDRAIQDWSAVVGPEHVISDPATLRDAETATFTTTRHVPLILRPGDRHQVQACLRIANEREIPIYPISTGLRDTTMAGHGLLSGHVAVGRQHSRRIPRSLD
jgi:FAD/FMN-containing dehydrogenase